MTTPRVQLSDQLIKSALISRDVRSGARIHLVADVLDDVRQMPQQSRWDLKTRRGIGLMPAAALLGLLLATVALGLVAGSLIPHSHNDIVFAHGDWVGNQSEGDLHNIGIYVVGSGGGESTRLLDVPFTESEHIAPPPEWSPDGSMIAFRLGGEHSGLYTANRDGTGLRLLAAATTELKLIEESWSFAWSPDSTRIAFISPVLSPLPPNMDDPGNRARFGIDDGAAYVVHVATGSTKMLVDEAPRAAGASGSIAWSPDGSMIAFGRNHAAARSGIVVAHADGSGEMTLTDTAYGPDGARDWGDHVGAIAWSPDGTTIAFTQERFSADSSGWYVMTVNSDGTGLRELSGEEGPCCLHGAYGGQLIWSPDGNWIGQEGGDDVLILDPDGISERRLIPGSRFDWSPDGTQLVVVAPESETPPGTRHPIYVLHLESGERVHIADGDYPDWLGSPR